MNNDVKEILISEDNIKEKVKELGQRISKDYEGESVFLIGILKGSVPFMADLMREITIPVTMDFMAVSSYGNGTTSTGVVRILKDLDFELNNVLRDLEFNSNEKFNLEFIDKLLSECINIKNVRKLFWKKILRKNMKKKQGEIKGIKL